MVPLQSQWGVNSEIPSGVPNNPQYDSVYLMVIEQRYSSDIRFEISALGAVYVTFVTFIQKLVRHC